MATPQLNRKLLLEQASLTSDGAGGYTETWLPVGTLWASLVPSSAREADRVGMTLSSVPVRITVRAAPHGTASRPEIGQRFREGDRLFRIYAVTEADPKLRFLTCFAREEEVRP